MLPMDNVESDPIIQNDSGGSFPAGRVIGGLLLVLPGLLLYLIVQFQPLLMTISDSTAKIRLPGQSEFVGAANFNRLLEDPVWMQAIGYTVAMVFVRIVVVAIVPLLVGVLIGGQGYGGRAVHRLIFAILGVLVSPIALSMLATMFLSPIWGRQPSPLGLDQPPLTSPDGARQTLIMLDAAITAVIGMIVGGTAFVAVMRGSNVSPSAGRAGIGVWLLGIFLAAISFPQTFDLAYNMTAGGPINSTMTLPLKFWNDSFRNLNMGYGAAEGVLMLFPVFSLALLIWLVVTGFRLRLSFTPPPQRSEAASLLSFLSMPLVIIIGTPLLVLVVWGIWLTLGQNENVAVNSQLGADNALLNSLIGPWTAIWLIQIPLTYLLALGLGFVRPFGRLASDILFLLLLLLAFIPGEVLSIAWYNSMREAGAINTHTAVAIGFAVNPLSLLIFKLFFDGAREKYLAVRAEGQTVTDAFLNSAFLPSIGVVLVVGAVLSFMSAQALFWPLLVLNSPDMQTLSIKLLALRGQFATSATVLAQAALSFIGNLAIFFVPVFLLLQLLVVDRLAILAGPPLAGVPSKSKPKRTIEEVVSVGFDL